MELTREEQDLLQNAKRQFPFPNPRRLVYRSGSGRD